MKLPELMQRQAIKRLDHFCQQAAQDHRHPRRLQYGIEGQQVNLFEVRLSSCGQKSQQIPVAQIRYSPQLNQWTLHYQNGRHWQLYLNVNPSLDLDKLLAALRQDPMGCFWSD